MPRRHGGTSSEFVTSKAELDQERWSQRYGLQELRSKKLFFTRVADHILDERNRS